MPKRHRNREINVPSLSDERPRQRKRLATAAIWFVTGSLVTQMISLAPESVTWMKGHTSSLLLVDAPLPSNATHYHPAQTQKFLRYFELQDQINKTRHNPHSLEPKSFNTAYNRATVVKKAPWLPFRHLCKETCCVESVAISLDQDDHQIIHGRDGLELADLAIHHYDRRRQARGRFKFHAQSLNESMLPCLIPGTIIYLENHVTGLNYFWKKLRPQIRVPFILITSGSDGGSPQALPENIADPLLIKWYGTNPTYYSSIPEFQGNFFKFQPMKLGLSGYRFVKQEDHILPYLVLNNFTNPFLQKKRWDFSKQHFDFSKDVFVHFGLHTPQRRALWKVLCPTNSTTSASCNKETINLEVSDIYSDMSRYRFGISPEGIGHDCHRTYEMLLLGVIPIIEERIPESHDLLKALPVIQMSDMKNAKSQQDFVDVIKNYVGSDQFQKANFEAVWEHLFLKHVRRLLLQDTGRDKEILFDEQGREYYQAYHYSVHSSPLIDSHTEKGIFCGDQGSCEVIDDGSLWRDWSKEPLPKLQADERSFLEEWERTGKNQN